MIAASVSPMELTAGATQLLFSVFDVPVHWNRFQSRPAEAPKNRNVR
jgi:hypothetical protein